MTNQGKPLVYCNTCTAFPINKAAEDKGRAWCNSMEEERGHDYRACVLHTPVSASERARRRNIVAQLVRDQQGAEVVPQL